MRLSPSPNPSFARSFLSTVTLLALGQSAFAYEFTPKLILRPQGDTPSPCAAIELASSLSSSL